MNIGIIVYSQTGNTLSVAKRIKEKLISDGHNVAIERLSESSSNTTKVDAYDGLLIGSPIHGFSLSAPMKEFLTNNAKLEGKKVNCFVTQSLGGGKRAIKQIASIAQEKQATMENSAVIKWSSPKREAQIKEAIRFLCVF